MELQTCRLCLRGSEKAMDIFHLDENDSSIAQVLEKHFWFELQPDDVISRFICSTCWTQVTEFHQFYISIQEAHKQYELKPPLKVEIMSNVATWDEEVLLPTEVLALENATSVSNPLDENDLPQDMLKTEPDAGLETEFGDGDDDDKKDNITDIDDYGDEDYKEELDDHDDDDDEDYNVEADKEEEHKDDDNVIVTRRGKISRNKTICNTKTKSKKKQLKKTTRDRGTVGLIRKVQNFPPFCKEDVDLMKKYIVMACELCIFLADSFEGIRDHFKEKHPNQTPFVKCCGRKLGKRCLIVEHARVHADPEYIKCKDCGKVFSNSSLLRSHWLAYHVPEEDCRYECDQCDKRFSRSLLLELHKGIHVPFDERKYICKLCPKHNAFTTDYHLQVHISMQHKKAPNICHACGKKIRDKAVFEKHVRLHFEDSGPRVKCPRPNCDSWLKDEDNLKVHLRHHNDEGVEFLCNQCGKNCKNKRALLSHIRYSHTNVVYTCEHCNKTFKKEIGLKEHMAQHTGEPLYKCPFCARTFNSSANMHSHKKKMHPVEWDNWRKTKRCSSQAILPSAQVAQILRGQPIDVDMKE